jgi:pyruvate dehydrogenase E2 component (dihydrolipoamide acetyltransferase)
VARVALNIPKVGLVMEAVRITRWLKQVGDLLTVGEPLLEVETEKSLVEIEATVGGRLAEILVAVDQEARVGDRIAWVETAEAPVVQPSGPAPPVQESVPVQPPVRPATVRAGERVHSSPVARRVAAEHGLDLGQVTGSGPRGRVQLADVQRAIGSATTPVPPSRSAPASPGLAPCP